MILKGCLMVWTSCVYDFGRLFNDFELNLNDLSTSLNNFGSLKNLQRGAGRQRDASKI